MAVPSGVTVVPETLTRNVSPCAAPSIVKSTSTRLFHGQRWRARTLLIDASASADAAKSDASKARSAKHEVLSEWRLMFIGVSLVVEEL